MGEQPGRPAPAETVRAVRVLEARADRGLDALEEGDSGWGPYRVSARYSAAAAPDRVERNGNRVTVHFADVSGTPGTITGRPGTNYGLRVEGDELERAIEAHGFEQLPFEVWAPLSDDDEGGWTSIDDAEDGIFSPNDVFELAGGAFEILGRYRYGRADGHEGIIDSEGGRLVRAFIHQSLSVEDPEIAADRFNQRGYAPPSAAQVREFTGLLEPADVCAECRRPLEDDFRGDTFAGVVDERLLPYHSACAAERPAALTAGNDDPKTDPAVLEAFRTAPRYIYSRATATYRPAVAGERLTVVQAPSGSPSEMTARAGQWVLQDARGSIWGRFGNPPYAVLDELGQLGGSYQPTDREGELTTLAAAVIDAPRPAPDRIADTTIERVYVTRISPSGEPDLGKITAPSAELVKRDYRDGHRPHALPVGPAPSADEGEDPICMRCRVGTEGLQWGSGVYEDDMWCASCRATVPQFGAY